jgi:HAD superfamily hydrolase (TIGR01509 family)
MAKTIKAILFDLNGVIINDESIHELAFVHVINKHGHDLSHLDYYKYCFGKTDLEGFAYLISKLKLDVAAVELVKEKADLYLENIKDNIRSYPGVLELISDLKGKYKFALVSSSNKNEVEMTLKYFKIEKYFGAVITASDIKRGKPDPEPYLKALKALKLKPINCVAIEDSPNGVKSAKAAGVKCFGVLTTHDNTELAAADMTFSNFFELKNYIVNNL